MEKIPITPVQSIKKEVEDFLPSCSFSVQDNIQDLESQSDTNVDYAKLSTVANNMDITGDNHIEEIPSSPSTGEDNSSSWLNFKCVFCKTLLTSLESPKLLECLHAVCNSCLTSKIIANGSQENISNYSGEVVCSKCHVTSLVSNLIDHQYVFELANPGGEISEAGPTPNTDIKCTSCKDDVVATSWCVECSEFICTNCVDAHQRLKITKEHTIKPKEEADQENASSALITGPKNLFCSIHRQERLTLFCEACDKLTCRDCQLSEHRDHRYKFIHEIATDLRQNINSLLSEVTYKRMLLNSAMNVIDDRQELINKKRTEITRDITNLFLKLTKLLNKRSKDLLLQLNDVCNSKHKTLNEKKLALKQLSGLTDHCINFVQGALNKGSDMALLSTKKNLTCHLNRIKAMRADIPNPDIPVRILLSIEKLSELARAISHFGSIMVDGKPFMVNGHSTPSPIHPSTPSPIPLRTILPQMQNSNQRLPTSPHNRASPNTNPHTPRASPQTPLGQPPLGQPPHGQPPLGPMCNVPVSMHLQAPPQQNYHPLAPRYSTLPYQIQRNIIRTPNNSSHIQLQVFGTPNQQQVTSSTDNNSSNLRGLLSQQAIYPPNTNPMRANMPPNTLMIPNNAAMYRPHMIPQAPQQQQQQQQQQPSYSPQGGILQVQRFNTNGQPLLYQFQGQPTLMQHPHQNPNPHQNQNQKMPPMIQPASNLWHIPPGSAPSPNLRPPPNIDESFKITLRQQQPKQAPPVPTNQTNSLSKGPGIVTSSVPKTPSPNSGTNGGKIEDAEKSIDSYCQESVNDLMETIAKLDRNGIEVLPEANKGNDQLVDSTQLGNDDLQKRVESDAKDDPNEDWCAVCMDGGELICCDKCPKVFHPNCHIPPLNPKTCGDTWQCLLCSDVRAVEKLPEGNPPNGLSPSELRLAQRILLELFCHYEPSLHFREVVGPQVEDYHKIIKKPMSLEVIRKRLDPRNPIHYTSLKIIISDIKLIFKNAYKYNNQDDQVYKDAVVLDELFDSLILKWLPAYSIDSTIQNSNTQEDDEDDTNPRQKKYRRITPD